MKESQKFDRTPLQAQALGVWAGINGVLPAERGKAVQTDPDRLARQQVRAVIDGTEEQGDLLYAGGDVGLVGAFASRDEAFSWRAQPVDGLDGANVVSDLGNEGQVPFVSGLESATDGAELSLEASGAAALAFSTQQFQVLADPTGPRLVSLATNAINVNENTATGAVQVAITRSGPLDGVVDVTYRSIPISATAGADFVSVSNTIRFQDGESQKLITVPIINDSLLESPERFTFVLELAQGASLGVPRTADIVIVDDDGGPPPPPSNDGESYGYAASLTTVLSGLERPVSVAWLPGDAGTMLVGNQAGLISVVKNGVTLSTPMLDISSRVNFVADRGLMDFALDPDFANNPYLYVAYVYDPPQTAGFAAGSLAGADGAGNRPARVSRFEVTLDANGVPKANPASEVVLIGTNGTWENISGPGVNSTLDLEQAPSGINPVTGENLRDYIAVDSNSHAPGALEFGPDGKLYVTIGDGTSFNALDERALRVQDVDNLSGKVLRVDRFTGDGVADNPFWNGDADSNASKVYQLGLRNGFRMEIDQQNGQVWVGDVGWFLWERILTGGAGANYGWPYYEGGDRVLLPQPSYSALPEAAEFFADQAAGLFTVTAPYRAFAHDGAEPGPQFAAIMLGEIYRGSAYPAEFVNDLFFADFLSGTIYTMDVNDPNRVERPLTQSLTATDMVVGPDGFVYVVSNFGGTVQRLNITGDPAPPPAALPQVTFSHASTEAFRQDRADSFTTVSPLAGQYRQVDGATLDIEGVAATTNVEMFMTLDNLLLISPTAGFGSVNNLYVNDADGVNVFAALFRDVEVVSTSGPNLVIVDNTQRGRVEFGNSNDTLVVSIQTSGGVALGPENTFTANLGGGSDSMLITANSAGTRLIVDAGAGADTTVVQGLADVRLTGGTGNDIMVLTAGAHDLVIRNGDGQDIVGSFTSGRDTIQFVGVAPSDVTFEFWAEGGGTLIRYGDGDDHIALVGTPFAQFSQADLVFVAG